MVDVLGVCIYFRLRVFALSGQRSLSGCYIHVRRGASIVCSGNYGQCEGLGLQEQTSSAIPAPFFVYLLILFYIAAFRELKLHPTLQGESGQILFLWILV